MDVFAIVTNGMVERVNERVDGLSDVCERRMVNCEKSVGECEKSVGECKKK